MGCMETWSSTPSRGCCAACAVRSMAAKAWVATAWTVAASCGNTTEGGQRFQKHVQLHAVCLCVVV